jgi:hypothetical protein
MKVKWQNKEDIDMYIICIYIADTVREDTSGRDRSPMAA